MKKAKYTVLFEKDRVYYKLCKIIFEHDGSYYVTVPYHSAQKGHFTKQTVNYNKPQMWLPIKEAIDVGHSDQNRIKLSHHPNGFIQFSGKGLISGKDSEENIKGMGIMSWPLNKPVKGPAFGVTIIGVEKFEQESKPKGNICVFHQHEIGTVPGANGLILEGHYFSPKSRRFIQTAPDGARTISVNHPTGILLPLKVILAPDSCAIPGFFGLELWADALSFKEIQSGFALSSSTGNIKKNERGDIIGDALFCFYPLIDGMFPGRNLTYTKITH
jgi:hypothetical protein